MNNVIVTGGAGFLGSHIAKNHILRGDHVLVLDDFSTSLGPESEHVIELSRHENCSISHCDISNKDEVEDSVSHWAEQQTKNIGMKIYNFACPASPPRYQSDPVKTMMTSVVGTKNMLDVAKARGAVLLQASTSEVYGDPDISPQVESYWGRVNSYGKRSCYDEGKRAAESLCYDYYHKLNVDVRVVRIFNTYGPNMDPADGRVVSNFIMQALEGKPLTIYGDGSQTRSFCYVSDLIKIITRYAGAGVNLQIPMNIGNPSEFTILELAQIINEKTKNKSGIIFKDLPADDPTQRKPNISLAHNVFDWKPEVNLNEGIDLSIDYFKKFL